MVNDIESQCTICINMSANKNHAHEDTVLAIHENWLPQNLNNSAEFSKLSILNFDLSDKIPK